ncbi:MAG: hypothetical protein GF401_18815 [Chitinivibrionales bacterium]|nr:hypothetical protein [Chitinivibrionales bacterium]
MLLKRFNYMISLLLLIFQPSLNGSPAERLDMFDSSGNPLFYVLFHYNGGTLNGRTVYDYTGKERDSRGYILTRSTATLDNSGKRSGEEYRNTVDLRTAWSTWAYGGDGGSFAFYDHFSAKEGKKEYEGSYAPGIKTGVYEFFDNTSTQTHRIQYHYDGAELSKIDVYDANGTLTHYGIVNATEVDALPLVSRETILGLRISRSAGRVTVSFNLSRKKHPRIFLYNLQGQMVSKLLDRRLAGGYHRFVYPTTSRESGIYLVVLMIDNVKAVRKIRVVN